MTAQLFLKTNAPDGGLLQSDEWSQLQAASGHVRYSFSGPGFEGWAFLHELPVVGRYLFIPRGPVVEQPTTNNLQPTMKSEFLRVAKESQAGWMRVEPQTAEALEILRTTFGGDWVVPAPRDINPRETFRVSLDGEPSAWLERMKSKTRYNVRLAEKHGVTVRFSRKTEDLEAFINLIYATTNRKAIAPHPKEYYRKFVSVLSEELCTIALAEHDGQVIAASLLTFYAGTSYYLHGGSADVKRELMAPFLLHFESMKEAKHRGCTLYDFGGVSTQPTTNDRRLANSSWAGITRFKQGFDPGAETLLFPGTYDIILSPRKYHWYRTMQGLSRFRRTFRKWISNFPV